MTNDELSHAIANLVNGLVDQHAEGDKMTALNVIANVMSFCVQSLMLNFPADKVYDVTLHMLREAEQKDLLGDVLDNPEAGHD